MKTLLAFIICCINVAFCTTTAAQNLAAADNDSPAEEIVQNLYIIGLLMFMAFYFFVESLFEKHKPPLGHTTGVIISLGVLLSYIIFVICEKSNKDKATGDLINYIEFRPTIFFDVVLPLIVFPSGYNMRRKKFFQNIGTVMKFGFLATLVCFAIYSGLFFAASELGLLTRPHPEADGQVQRLDIGAYEILSICSLLCSSDVIAAISMVDFGKSPKLFSIIYGEGVFNDIVSIILFGVVQKQFPADGGPAPELTWSSPGTIITDFFILALKSLSLGMFFGFLSAILFKKFRLLTHSPISETLIIQTIGFIAYFTSEAGELSGIISLLTCGVIMAHYTWYNLSPQGKTISSVSYSIFGSIAESLVFIYIGLSVFSYFNKRDPDGYHGPKNDYRFPCSWSTIGCMTVIVIVGRCLAVWSVHFAF